MNIKRVKITGDECGWKGTWYKCGETHFVIEVRKKHVASAYSAVRITGGIDDSDCEEMGDWKSRLLCWLEWAKIKLGKSQNWSGELC